MSIPDKLIRGLKGTVRVTNKTGNFFLGYQNIKTSLLRELNKTRLNWQSIGALIKYVWINRHRKKDTYDSFDEIKRAYNLTEYQLKKRALWFLITGILCTILLLYSVLMVPTLLEVGQPRHIPLFATGILFLSVNSVYRFWRVAQFRERRLMSFTHWLFRK